MSFLIPVGLRRMIGMPIFVREKEEEKKPDPKDQEITIKGMDGKDHKIKISGDDFESVAKATTIIKNAINSPLEICVNAEIIGHKTGKKFGIGSGIILIIHNTTTDKYIFPLFSNKSRENILFNKIKDNDIACKQDAVISSWNAQFWLLGASKNLFVVKKTLYLYEKINDIIYFPIIIDMTPAEIADIDKFFMENTKFITEKSSLFNNSCYSTTTAINTDTPNFKEVKKKGDLDIIAAIKLMYNHETSDPDISNEWTLTTKQIPTLTCKYVNKDPVFPQFDGLHRYIIE